MRHKSGQVSIEHMITIAIAVFILIPGTTLFYHYAKTTNEDVLQKQISRLGDEIVKSSELVWALGKGSKLVMKTNIPDNVNNITLVQDYGTEITFYYTTLSGSNEMMFYSPRNLTSPYYPFISEDFHSGAISISIYYDPALNNRLIIQEVT